MQPIALTLTLILLTPVATCAKVEGFSACIPEGVQLSSEVQLESSTSPSESKPKPKTLQVHLDELKARCQQGKLVDRRGKEIRIVQLIGCWGNPPDDYQEQLDRQQAELKRLREKYIVIEIPCSSNKVVA
jgi:hypothetical protein